jgi:hypothetical protein
MSSESDIYLLFRSTLRMYGTSLYEAIQGFRHLWWAAWLPYLYFAVLLSSSIIAYSLLGRFLGGLVIGLVSTLVMSHYLGLVGLAVRMEKASIIQSWETAKELFFPLMGLLFSLFILNMVANAALGRPDQRWIRSSLNLFVLIAFNPLPEVLYLRQSQLTLETFGESLEFVKQNIVEWFLPMIVVLMPFLVSNPVELLITLGYANPLGVGFSAALFAISRPFLFSLMFLPVVFIFLTFRGVLYLKLAGSTRRKRIYQERFGR